MAEEIAVAPLAPAPVLFTLDLGPNGGMLGPTTGKELNDWIQAELKFWDWAEAVPGFPQTIINQALGALRNAGGEIQVALQQEGNAPDAFRERVNRALGLLQDAYVNRGLPHSSSQLAQRVEQIRQRDVVEACAYLFAFLTDVGHHFSGADVRSWRGLIEGLVERYGIAPGPSESFNAALQSVSELHGKMERLLGEKTQVCDGLHRNYEAVAQRIAMAEAQQSKEFKTFIDTSQKTHDDALEAHKTSMANLQQAFREEMALRAPVDYWETRKVHHESRSRWLGACSFGLLAALAGGIGLVANWVLSNLGPDGKPDAWRLSVLVLLGVLGIWAVRLVVRLFLSHIHLATDAAERVTMVKTYLSLLESDKLPSDDDRKLILQALFRPATDGIVKDEGLPHPAMEALTRLGSR